MVVSGRRLRQKTAMSVPMIPYVAVNRSQQTKHRRSLSCDPTERNQEQKRRTPTTPLPSGPPAHSYMPTDPSPQSYRHVGSTRESENCELRRENLERIRKKGRGIGYRRKGGRREYAGALLYSGGEWKHQHGGVKGANGRSRRTPSELAKP
jgi:hypothetical protein